MFVISPTDNNWFQFLKDSGLNSFVNFWTPTPWNIKRLKPGERWYFILKSPIRKVGGFGEFVEYKNLVAIEAWKEFGQRNGCIDKAQFVSSIQLYIDKNSEAFGGISIDFHSYKIGCIILNNCQFWEVENFQRPEDNLINFATQVVKYKYFEQNDPFLNKLNYLKNFNLLTGQREQYKREVNQRKGQSEFKAELLKAYKYRCCVSGESCPELLEAGHLQPYLSEDSNHIQNGILLRVDIHRLLDSGLISIDSNYVVQVSSLIKSTTYQQYQGKKISLPDNDALCPSKESLQLNIQNFRN